MHTSDWIALAACIAAFIALVPAYLPLFRNTKSKTRVKGKVSTLNITPEEDTPLAGTKPPLNNFGEALVLSALALIVGVIEIVLFSAIANFFGIAVEVNTMPTNWLVVFYFLFLLPGLLFFRAIMSISNMFTL